MTKQELDLILSDIVKVRDILAPEQAVKVPYLFPDAKKEGQDIVAGTIYRVGNRLYKALKNVAAADKTERTYIFTPDKWGVISGYNFTKRGE